MLRPSDDSALPAFGLGLTDLNKTDVSSRDDGIIFDSTDIERRISTSPPAWVVFNGLRAPTKYTRWKGFRDPSYGFQDWTISDSMDFVVNSSGNNWDDRVLRGRTAVEWWQDAGRHINETRKG